MSKENLEVYKKENNVLGNSFLNYYFRDWKKDEDTNWSRVEFIGPYSCNQACRYCYVNRYRHRMEPEHTTQEIYDNASKILDWMVDNDLGPNIDYFSGEPFVHNVTFEVLYLAIDKLSQLASPPKLIVIPSNFTWVPVERVKRRVERLLTYSREKGIPVLLSASVDGKFIDSNRPISVYGNYTKTDQPLEIERDDRYYEEIFKFASKWGFSFHPMLYSTAIEKWRDNWLWYQKMFAKYEKPFHSIYLLEVRNKEWTPEQIKELGNFLEFLLTWTWHHFDYQKEPFINFIFGDGYNILRPFTSTGRGMGCSIQSTVMIRLADLTIVPCHRTAYPEFKLAHFSNGRWEIDNPELLIGHTVCEQKAYPACEQCGIKYSCNGGCFGAQFEVTGDMFSPIPSVCMLEHYKVFSIIKWFRDHGLLGLLLDRVQPKFKVEIQTLLEMGKNLQLGELS